MFGSYISHWAPNNLRASVNLICYDGIDTVASMSFSLVKEFKA